MIDVIISQPSAVMLDCETRAGGISALKRIEAAGRVSHKSEDRGTADTWERFITSVVMGHGDWSITEHETCRVSFYCDRGISHELVRHRLGSYTQESTRFVNYSKRQSISFIAPFEESSEDADIWYGSVKDSVDNYQLLISRGKKPEMARSVLPISLATTLVVTFNFRMWRLFFLMRTSKEAHPQMRQLTIPLLARFQANIPLLFDDIVPGSRQVDNLQKAR